MTTVVFADLVGSTSMFQRLGDETASRFVTQLMGLLCQVFEHHRGRVIKVLGDGIFVVFEHEGDALVASISIQKRLLDKPIYAGGSGAAVQLQMGIDSGEVVEIAGDCFGDTVNSAARLIPRTDRLNSFANNSTKCCASKTMSRSRTRRGGISMRSTFKR